MDSGDAGRDDCFRAKWHLGLGYTKNAVGCKWVYTIKLNPNGSLARLKVCLVAKGFSQVYGLDYVDTFSPIVKMTSVRILISLATTYHWPLHQLDIKNVFLNDII